MSLETGTYISDLNAANPTATDPKSQGDDHLRLIKATVKATFPNLTGAVTPTQTELNYVDGVTSAIQAQIDAKGAIAGQTWTGTHNFPTQSAGDNSTKAATTAYVDAAGALKGSLTGATWTGTQSFTGATITVPTVSSSTNDTTAASTAFVQQVAFAAALPVQSTPGVLYTNGSTASWRASFVGDSGSGGQLGPVPAPAAGESTRFLKGDGTWALAPFAPDVIVQNQLSSGTNGGILTSGSWATRVLNTAVRNNGSIASLSSNQVTLGAGTYLMRGRGTFGAPSGVGALARGRHRIYNVTDSAVVGQGEPCAAIDGTPNATCEAVGVVTIAGSKAFALQYYVTANGGLEGIAVSTGSVEVYATLEITRIA